RFKSLLLLFLKITEIHFVPDEVRDADDNYLLGICDSCQAQYLITGDKDLLVLGNYRNTSIVSMSQFIRELET
ncbi:MAG: putative toxin-antitoxin system toxin component, PIN family, partial [Leadbetterella sp.]|nr:putative toxin-antitoxin system toxin component, PIN family [Leadbetterella sp.]